MNRWLLLALSATFLIASVAQAQHEATPPAEAPATHGAEAAPAAEPIAAPATEAAAGEHATEAAAGEHGAQAVAGEHGAQAAEGEGHGEAQGEAHGEGPGGPNWVQLGVAVVNFALFIYLLVRFAKTPLLDFLGNRRRTYEEALAAARRREAEARQVFEEYSAKLVGVEEEAARILKNADLEAQRRRTAVVEAARVAADKMKRDARLTIDSEVGRARTEIRTALARLVAERAQASLERALGPEDDRRLVDEFVRKLEDAL
jgi:F-type H+-transporting ATPase subunit b